ncbi:unnamed protein product [Arabis nemorensis]|uniref:Uncharacterized protein n=1 Tax=Arabis nemorensis TaxID=586526 RepID=A0A565BHR0_9BRAS|nr:unnamed protein product [Arabis nemorensis]
MDSTQPWKKLAAEYIREAKAAPASRWRTKQSGGQSQKILHREKTGSKSNHGSGDTSSGAEPEPPQPTVPRTLTRDNKTKTRDKPNQKRKQAYKKPKRSMPALSEPPTIGQSKIACLSSREDNRTWRLGEPILK